MTKGVIYIIFSEREKKIIEIVKEKQPITSEEIANLLNITRAAIRADLSVLTKLYVLEARPKVGYFYIGNINNNLVLEKANEIKVGQVQSLPSVVDEKLSVYEVIVKMFLEDVGTIYILSDGYLSGVVSRKDLIQALVGGKDINNLPIGLIMTRMPNLIMTHEEESIIDAAKKLIEHQIDSLPVVEKFIIDGIPTFKVLGRLSKTNISKVFVYLAFGD